MDLIDLVELRRTVHREDRNHSRSEAAVGNDVDARGFCFGIECELLIDDVVIAAEIAKVRAGLDRRLRQRFVVPVVDARDRRIMTAHQPRVHR